MTAVRPTLRTEKRLLGSGATWVAGMDEVGRGALAGPVTVGVVVVDATIGRTPAGLRDSKLLTAHARERLVPSIVQWASGWGTGSASAGEIDAVGIMAALQLAGRRALASWRRKLGDDPGGGVVVLDGNVDWLGPIDGEVVTRVKADLVCASVAAASVLAKVERDAGLVALDAEHPEFGWVRNKGYGAAEHREALATFGPTPHHRTSWNLGV